MSKIFSNTNLIIIGAIVAAILVWYFFFSGSAPATSDILQTTTSTSTDQLVSDLNQIKSLTLDADIFSNPAFTSLVDSTVVVQSQPVGRPNPFAPLPSLTPVPAQASLSAPATQ